MNKIFNINLGGYPFTIDQDAYEYLQNYLERIDQHFRSSEGYEEITSDIEARVAELFQEKLNSRKIVTMKDVKETIVVMGTPEDFGAESLDEEMDFNHKADSSKSSSSNSQYRTGKRLFRNTDDEVVAGVCSGIAAYFGVEDPLWVRILFVLITFSGGFGIPAYLIMWAILPKAESASDRLSMKGEPINVSNIGKIIEDEIENISEKVSDFGTEFGSKKKELVEEVVQELPLRKGSLL